MATLLGTSPGASPLPATSLRLSLRAPALPGASPLPRAASATGLRAHALPGASPLPGAASATGLRLRLSLRPGAGATSTTRAPSNSTESF